MTDRERWIVYPLLFMTLGLTMRDRVAPPSPGFMQPGVNALTVRCTQLECRALTVIGPKGNMRVRLGVTPNQAGQMEVYGSDHTMVFVAGADDVGQSGKLRTFSADMTPQVTLHSTDQGGQLATFDRDNKSRVLLGYDGLGPGTFLIESDEEGLTGHTFQWLPIQIGKIEGSRNVNESRDSNPAQAEP